MEIIKLTQFSPGAGCGCKIAPRELQKILAESGSMLPDINLLVGYDKSDDAAVYDIGSGKAIISTTDFFTPIVDDPFLFGQIAATNALSDIYAMGGKPLMAISILGWPLEKLPASVASDVIAGARKACADAGINIAGGHSISIGDPIFGLAVTGILDTANLKKNSTANKDCIIYLTKPLGIGIVSTAQKKGFVQTEHLDEAVKWMCLLNKAGAEFALMPEVKAMTDVTGFGLLGHLSEICQGSELTAVLNVSNIPFLDGLLDYIQRGAVPGGTNRNWNSYGHLIGEMDENTRILLCDPQTSGGLLLAVDPALANSFENICHQKHIFVSKIGKFVAMGEKSIVFDK